MESITIQQLAAIYVEKEQSQVVAARIEAPGGKDEIIRLSRQLFWNHIFAKLFWVKMVILS